MHTNAALFVLPCYLYIFNSIQFNTIYIGGYNERDYAWIAYRDWIYAKKFELTSDLFKYDSVWLECGGLDTVANIRSALHSG